jgi:hypothetical protein
MHTDSAEYLKTEFIAWVITHPKMFNSHRDCLGVEVPFSANKRMADVLLIRETNHAFEIKGDLDNLTKLRAQLADYNKTFEEVTVITTQKHLKKIVKLIPKRIGILVFAENGFKQIRKPKKRIRLDKNSLLMFLKKNEITPLLKDKYRLSSTDYVRKIAGEQISLHIIRKAVQKILARKYSPLFKLFLKDIGKTIHTDDLLALTGQIQNLH